MGPEIRALFVEAASLVRPDKWKTWEIPGYNDFQEIKSPRSAIRYQIKNGKYGRYKWSDGSIHCTKTFGFFQKDYVGFDGFQDRFLFWNRSFFVTLQCYALLQKDILSKLQGVLTPVFIIYFEMLDTLATFWRSALWSRCCCCPAKRCRYGFWVGWGKTHHCIDSAPKKYKAYFIWHFSYF